MSYSIHISVLAIVLVTIHANGNVCFAQVTEYLDRESWYAAVGEYTTIQFDEVPTWTWLSDEYERLGVRFTDGSDQAQCCDLITYPGDGAGLSGFSSIELQFLQPMMWIAVDFPGNVQFQLYSGDSLVFQSGVFGKGGVGNFGGLISSLSFDRAILTDPFDGFIFIDDLHFGPSIPAPAVAPLLAGLLLRRRRRLA